MASRILLCVCTWLWVADVAFTFEFVNTTASFDKWRARYSVQYRNLEESVHRFSSWSENLAKVIAHNARADRGEVTFRLGMNRFADLTNDE